MRATPYLSFDGTCDEAFRHYASVLNGTIDAMMTYEGTPLADDMPQEARAQIIHASMRVGDSVIMGADVPASHYQRPQGFTVSIQVDSSAEVERIFGAFAEGGQVLMPLEENFWAHRVGLVADRFGTPWMISCVREM